MASNFSVTDEPLRIILIGRTGHGKSSTGNTSLDQDVFKADMSPTSVTKTCQYEKRVRLGREVEVVDTPGFFDTNLSNQDILKELINSLVYTMPGFHAIVFVLKPDRFTNELVETKKIFFKWFCGNVQHYAMIILTHSRNKEDVDLFFDKNTISDLTKLRAMCVKAVLPFENKTECLSVQDRDAQVEELFNQIDLRRKQTGTEHFTNVKYKLATIYVDYKLQNKSNAISTNSICMLRGAGLTRDDLKELGTETEMMTPRPKI